jgi:hypothetical protein
MRTRPGPAGVVQSMQEFQTATYIVKELHAAMQRMCRDSPTSKGSQKKSEKSLHNTQHVAAGPSCQTMVRVNRTGVSKQCTVKVFSQGRRRNPRFQFYV